MPRIGIAEVEVRSKAALMRHGAAARDYGSATLAVGHAHTCTSLGCFTDHLASLQRAE